MWALRGQWHLLASRLKGSNFTDNMYCCKSLHLVNFALWNNKTLEPFTTSHPLFFNRFLSPRPVLIMIGHFLFCLFAAKSYKLSERHCIKYCNWPSFGSSLLLHVHFQSPILAAIQLKYCQLFVCMAVLAVLSSPSLLSLDTTLRGIKSRRKYRPHTHSSHTTVKYYCVINILINSDK